MGMRRRLVPGSLLVGSVLVFVAGCGSMPDRAVGGPAPVAKPASMERLRQQAREALARYDATIQQAGGAPVTMTPAPWDPGQALGAYVVDSAATTRGGRHLTVTFYGAPGPASEPCGADYTAEPVESPTAVTVIVTERARGEAAVCPAIAAWRTETVQLDRPLGERTVLETQQGVPVEVTITG
ncbi:hypothetical protein FXF53_00505 [Micromonospora sp. WP24]|uniref:hypothetical protein n=1 Tax=Micromonospora sp. WP24 TaxID=2604469 RepID=UPI0011D6B364|nr:hypothetical protein [Micromonospora sp. WP24]TYC07125.1 hypothetical protein FXF53_00505 [Micromonospora sp. WP24]